MKVTIKGVPYDVPSDKVSYSLHGNKLDSKIIKIPPYSYANKKLEFTVEANRIIDTKKDK